MLVTCEHLPAGIATVDDEVGTGGVRAGVGNKVDVGALELLGQAVAAHGDHVVPQLLDLLIDKVAEARVDVAWGDGVDAGKVAPLVGQRLGHVDAAGLGDVVRGLLLGEVGDVARHGGGDDQRAVALLLEDGADGLGAVGRAVQVGVDDAVPLLLGPVDDAAVGCGAGTVGDKVLAGALKQPQKIREQTGTTYLAIKASILPKSFRTCCTRSSHCWYSPTLHL